MNIRLVVVSRVRHGIAAFSRLAARRWKQNFYLYLAAAFTVFAVLDAAVLHMTSELRQATFDAMLRYRIVTPKPDPDIVIVDINEASLAAMAKDYGRWPWPRQVLGEFVEQIEKQHPRAVVFDILFSDADVYNPDSDAYFDAAIAATGNTYFPMLRLDAANDSLSQVKPAMIPGVTPMPNEERNANATVAVILPRFQAALNGGRLGTHNVYPDADGVTRSYPVYADNYGWRIPSLPARIGRDLGWPEPATQNILLNWHGRAFSYHYVSFSDVYDDMQDKVKRRPQDEFTNKIVLIGSTAPSLFDLKATPLARIYPGVEVLATAIDNIKHGDSLRFPEERAWYLLVTLGIVWLTALAFYRDAGRANIDRLFGLSQFILVALSYASINLTNTYINLTGPVTVGLAFFTVARIYAGATGKALERNMVRAAADRGGDLRATLLLIRFDTGRNVIPHALLEKIRIGLKKSGSPNKSVETLSGEQRGIWGLFEKTIAVSWMADAADTEAMKDMQRDVETVLATLAALLRKFLIHPDNAESHFVYTASIAGGHAADAGWRTVFAEALMAWDRQQEGTE
jgi:adenylate cyclase